MAAIDDEELTLLAAMAYGESYYKKNTYEEMAGIASVLLRQRDARGYTTMQKFTKAEPSYSFVVKDGNPRFAQLKETTEAAILKISADAETEIIEISAEIDAIKVRLDEEKDKKKEASTKTELVAAEKKLKKQRNKLSGNEGHIMAYRAARNALEGGQDYSNGAYFWDGWDVKTNYENHPKVKRGIKVTDPTHDVFGIQDKLVEVIKYKVVTTMANGKKTQTKEEIGRYNHLYESSAGYGGTIFWKFNSEYLRLEGAKEYI